jgi:DNA adenine methylase
VKPPFAYFGGKGRMAPWIASLLPPHRVYVEPFAGSAAVLLAKRRSTHEILNDVDGHVVHFFRVLRDQPDELEHALRLTPYAREEFDGVDPDVDIHPGLDDVERARRWWIRNSQSFAQTGTSSTGWATSIQRGSNNARSVQNRLGRFGDIAERLAGVVIENRDALWVTEHYDSPDGVVYLDPPYLGATRTSMRDGRRPGGDYAHEFDSIEHHRALADVARAATATVIISGYPSPLYDEDLYAGWDRIERRVLRRSSNGRSASQCHATEVLWSNRRIDAGHLDLRAAT